MDSHHWDRLPDGMILTDELRHALELLHGHHIAEDEPLDGDAP